ncbi:MAG: Gfo/Idh/MocA family oxidoreductase [Deltaproteobacteria bacterium]|jgi:D-galactose 1-dehydrogenase|nr:Gfo/Idh/MocA family oxidoreductase [Deltaproteobacteria bacterium]MBW2503395.1 Gfo/Idh/MocA family oxidoreductase [Deltaproteobacteria bacterium]MBW2520240.1 Gfo/Idh/MocA family oxidoreductase [Deltaproteobacteria bacterium]
MRIGLIGIGKIANYQMQAITHTLGIKLTDAHDLDPVKSEELPGSVQFFNDFDQMLKKSTADAFLVSTPTGTHFEVAMKIIEADRVAIVEKPLCTNQEQMDALMTAARTRKLPLYTVFHPSYGREVDWWREQRDAQNFDLGELIGFESCFADPYYIDGKLTLGAIGKAGAWIDSGISSLSVLSRLIDVGTMSVYDGRMTIVPSINCAQLQGLALLSFKSADKLGYGMIDTNWTLGKNYKTTRLRYQSGIVELDHAKEYGRLYLHGQEGLTFNLATDKPRLVNHYCGVFANLTEMHSKGEDNKELSEALHRLLFDALKR